MQFLPIFLDTKDKTILVIGGEGAAEAKLRTLVKTQAEITLIATAVSPEIKRWHDEGRLEIFERQWIEDDIKDVLIVYAATENPQENAEIARIAKDRDILVNAADQKEDCAFYSPAIVDRDPVIVAIGSEGTSPGIARAIKSDIEQNLPTGLGGLAREVAKIRTKIAASIPDFSKRQKIWARVFSGLNLREKLQMSQETLHERFEDAVSGVAEEAKSGKVSLVGAGPGGLDLLTIGAQRRLHEADVIVYDRLVSQEVLELGRKEAKYIYVGKSPGAHSTPQSEINRIIVEEAKQGQHVVRLKGGDPLVFGRADEEIEAVKSSGIDLDIVPGITSAAAAAASVGMSLTSRGHNKAITLLTGHDTKGFAEQDWKTLSAPDSRAAVYMGLGAARFIQGRLFLHGADPSFPVSIVENASRANEKRVVTTLKNMVQDIENKGINGPAILLLGFSPDAEYSVSLNKVGVST